MTHERVRELGRRTEVPAGGLKRPLLIEFQTRDRMRHHLETPFHLPHRGPEPVKRLAIHVLAVGVRRVLHRVDDRNPGSLKVRRLPLDVLESPGVLLLRHDGGTHRVRVIHFDVAVVRCRPDVEVKTEAGERVSGRGHTGRDIKAVIAARNAVDRVIDHFREPEEVRRHPAVDIPRGGTHGAASERRAV